jgi:hypothetical protein
MQQSVESQQIQFACCALAVYLLHEISWILYILVHLSRFFFHGLTYFVVLVSLCDL